MNPKLIQDLFAAMETSAPDTLRQNIKNVLLNFPVVSFEIDPDNDRETRGIIIILDQEEKDAMIIYLSEKDGQETVVTSVATYNGIGLPGTPAHDKLTNVLADRWAELMVMSVPEPQFGPDDPGETIH